MWRVFYVVSDWRRNNPLFTYYDKKNVSARAKAKTVTSPQFADYRTVIISQYIEYPPLISKMHYATWCDEGEQTEICARIRKDRKGVFSDQCEKKGGSVIFGVCITHPN